jgi:hypothetical protein
MKNVKSNKTLMSFAGSSMNLSEMKKVNGGWNGCKFFNTGCPNL